MAKIEIDQSVATMQIGQSVNTVKIEPSKFGLLLSHPINSPKGFAVFFPPATGDMVDQHQEASNLTKFGFASLLYAPPYISTPNLNRGKDQTKESALWLKAKSELGEILEFVRTKFGLPNSQIALIGKNLGGSVAAFSMSQPMGALIVTGAVPSLSRFWAKSDHDTAKRYRVHLSDEQIKKFRQETQQFDLVETLPLLKTDILFQVGRMDPWIESIDMELLQTNFPACHVQWLDDDHSMNSAEAIIARKIFLQERIKMS